MVYLTVYRLNTFPFVNGGFLHAFFNVAAFLPLMGRFESEHGTLVTLAMFLGREFYASTCSLCSFD